VTGGAEAFLLPVGVAVNIKHLKPMWERVHAARD
jgi:hypothetical protein